MPAFDRFLNRLFVYLLHGDAASKRALNREKAGARLLRRRWSQAEDRCDSKDDEIRRLTREKEELEISLAVTRQDLAQRTGAAEVQDAQVELLTAIIATYQAKEEKDATIHATRKGLAVDKLVRRDASD